MLLEFVLLLLLVLIVFVSIKESNLAPGPFQWPFIGNIFNLYLANPSYPHLALQKLADKYGNVFSLKLGVHKFVVLSSYEVIKNYMSRVDDFSDKYEFQFAKDRGYGKPLGIVHSSGESWNTLRKFSMKSLRNFIGVGNKNNLDEILRTEIQDLFCLIDQEMKSGYLTMDNFFASSSVNIVWAFVSGTRFDLKDSKLKKMIELNKKYTSSVSMDRFSVLFPWLGKIFPKISGYTKSLEVIAELQQFVMEMIEARKLAASSFEKPCENFIDAFLEEIKKEQPNIFNEQELVVILLDLFIGGSETTSNMLSFGILFMLLNAEVQTHVYREIKQISRLESLSYTHLKQMPYTHATILEIFRLALIIPVPFGRLVKSDTFIKQYKVKKGSCVIYNLNSIQMDPEYWENPHIFRPERFLNANMEIINEKRVPVFGFGKRICPGENLAKITFFSIFTSMIQRYEILSAKGLPLPSVTARPNANAQAPIPFSVFMKSRPIRG